ncbi:bacteriophage holin [Candidatus Woesearchaeota archaeon]|nr:bacteriophage holin [Candidatus Woesearchaeota archaeon]
MEKLDVKALAVGLGVLGALYVFLIGLGAMFGWGTQLASILASLYMGFEPTLLGSIIGAVWGFIDGAIAGAIIALVYNKIAGGKK